MTARPVTAEQGGINDHGYLYIVRYGRYFGCKDWYIQVQCDQSVAEGAPPNAIYAKRSQYGHRPEDGWATTADVTDDHILLALAPLPHRCDGPHELTDAQLAEIPEGAIIYYTDCPGVEAKPVTRVSGFGNIRLPNSQTVAAFADKLTFEPRRGMDHHCSRGRTLPHDNSQATTRRAPT